MTREEIAKRLLDYRFCGKKECEVLADWHLAEVAWIVEPLVEIKNKVAANTDEWNHSYTGSAINETLKRAGDKTKGNG